MKSALADYDSVAFRLRCIRELATDSVLVRVTPIAHASDTCSVTLSRVGFNRDRDGAVVVMNHFSRTPGACNQMLAAFLRKGPDGWEVTNYAVEHVSRIPRK